MYPSQCKCRFTWLRIEAQVFPDTFISRNDKHRTAFNLLHMLLTCVIYTVIRFIFLCDRFELRIKFCQSWIATIILITNRTWFHERFISLSSYIYLSKEMKSICTLLFLFFFFILALKAGFFIIHIIIIQLTFDQWLNQALKVRVRTLRIRTLHLIKVMDIHITISPA